MRAKTVSVIYFNPSNLYTVAVFETAENIPETAVSECFGGKYRFSVTGTGLPTRKGTECVLEGRWTKSKKYGMQFKAEQFRELLPIEPEGIEAYLSSGSIHGIGPLLAGRIVKKFGDKTFEIMDKEPEKLLTVRGISKKKLAVITSAWEANREDKELMGFLMKYGISRAKIKKIREHFGSGTLEILRKSPYRLCEISGFGFLTVDPVARKAAEFEPAERHRVSAAVEYVLREAQTRGHLYLDIGTLVRESRKLLNKGITGEQVSERRICRVISDMAEQENRIVYTLLSHKEGDYAVYLTKNYRYESGAAKELNRLLSAGCRKYEIESELKQIQKKTGVMLAEKQAEAVRTAFKSPVSIITGGPGMGKTATIRMILKAAEKKHIFRKVALLAPTGRAARKMQESTGMDAMTVNKALLLPDEDENRSSVPEQIEADLVIVDEFSMVDMRLAANLFAGIRSGARLVMVGDIDQLSSVGAGNVFRELIRSGVIPVTVLDVLFRQEEGSNIAENSRRINQGCAKLEYGDDFIFHSASTVEEAADFVVQMYKDEISKAGAAGQSVQILSPFRKSTEAGTVALNKRLQSEMNPRAKTRQYVQIGGEKFFQGDPVMQLKNKEDISNGDIGVITSVNVARQEVVAVYPDNRMAVYTPEDAGLVGLSYATTIHKSQGSEYPVVIVPMLEAFHIMLKRNLLYTAVTRASKKVILIGQWRAVYQAIRTDDVEKRNTLFARRLLAECRQKAA